MATKMKLENEGVQVITAQTGEKAVEVTRSSQQVELILMDIDLGPGIDSAQI